MTYNLTAVAGGGGNLLSFIQVVNTNLMNSIFGVALLIGLFFVFFLGLIYSTNSLGKASTTSLFICFTLSLAMQAMSLVPELATFIILILLIASLFVPN